MKAGDLARVKVSRSWGECLTAYSKSVYPAVQVSVSVGETVMLLRDMKTDEGYTDVLHPHHGVCSIISQALEAVVKKGDLMMVGTNPGWGEGDMKKGDLVVVVEPNFDAFGHGGAVGLAKVLHHNVGVCYIRKHRLEAV